MVAVTPALRAAAFAAGIDPHELAVARDVPAVELVTTPVARPGRRATAHRLTPGQVAALRALFAARFGGTPPQRRGEGGRFTPHQAGETVHEWFVARGRELRLGHATIRRAVYGFGAYAPGGAA
jgi:hypothetical protein